MHAIVFVAVTMFTNSYKLFTSFTAIEPLTCTSSIRHNADHTLADLVVALLTAARSVKTSVLLFTYPTIA